jgi:hypothetical protein
MRDPLHVGGTHSSQHILRIEAMSTALENASDRVRLLTDKRFTLICSSYRRSGTHTRVSSRHSAG